ncbi:C-type lectin domain family 7 member A isoform X3 [Rattus norvegicus]|uniref:C-type lectin domain family 7 member A isoform X3 n=1 Tax=Rattus norvegicus TaxID=10116 RepID=UPI0019175761|nr:C-type lectin domain family 7 member A isoform X3 [Rattus norvegicus]
MDEDGYTQLDFGTRNIHKRPVKSEKGSPAPSSRWRSIAVALGILCLLTVVVAAVLGALAFRRFNSGRYPEEKDNFPSRNKENHKPTEPSLDEKVAPSKASQTTGKGRTKGAMGSWIPEVHFLASFLDLAFPIGSCMPRAVIYLASQKIPGMEVGDTVPS